MGLNPKIDETGGILFAQALRNHQHPKNATTSLFERLSLFQSQVGQKGAKTFLSFFQKNTQLQQLWLIDDQTKI